MFKRRRGKHNFDTSLPTAMHRFINTVNTKMAASVSYGKADRKSDCLTRQRQEVKAYLLSMIHMRLFNSLSLSFPHHHPLFFALFLLRLFFIPLYHLFTFLLCILPSFLQSLILSSLLFIQHSEHFLFSFHSSLSFNLLYFGPPERHSFFLPFPLPPLHLCSHPVCFSSSLPFSLPLSFVRLVQRWRW